MLAPQRRPSRPLPWPACGCCGALHVHNGDADEARVLARRNVDAFERSGVDEVVVNAAGCGSTLKNYGHLLEDDPHYAGRAAAFAGRVRDVSEALARADLPPAPCAGAALVSVTLQEPCHLAHAQRIQAQPRAILRGIPGIELIEMEEPALCCGSAGVYNVVHPEQAGTLLARKVDNIVRTGVDIVATSNPGCQLQIEAGLLAPRGDDPGAPHRRSARRGVRRRRRPAMSRGGGSRGRRRRRC